MGLSGQFRGQSGHARASAEQKNICRFLVSGAAAAEVNVDKSGQFSQGARRRCFGYFLDFWGHFSDFSEISSLWYLQIHLKQKFY